MAEQDKRPHLFELWWERYMPEATQSQAWEAWQAAPRADGVGVAATPAPAPQWQPIETAPKDAAILLVVDGEVYAGCWYESAFRELRDADGWYVGQHDAQAFWCAYVMGECEPSHWMPLPAAPGQGKEASR